MIASVIGKVRAAIVPRPASRSTRMISSVAYAEEEMLSEAKTASPFALPMRSCSSRLVGIRAPKRRRRIPSTNRPGAVVGARTCSVATRWPASLRSNSRSNGRTMRTYRSPRRLPRRAWRSSRSGLVVFVGFVSGSLTFDERASRETPQRLLNAEARALNGRSKTPRAPLSGSGNRHQARS